ncbi:MAG: hypothetical protein NC548_28490 [Lachnospiraceae bacterium]|nr:hypothetical protein [Lachnospiraceae bacterium]MCM1234117.1 hypothetical protein [Ruminococcus flavefaciens]
MKDERSLFMSYCITNAVKDPDVYYEQLGRDVARGDFTLDFIKKDPTAMFYSTVHADASRLSILLAAWAVRNAACGDALWENKSLPMLEVFIAHPDAVSNIYGLSVPETAMNIITCGEHTECDDIRKVFDTYLDLFNQEIDGGDYSGKLMATVNGAYTDCAHRNSIVNLGVRLFKDCVSYRDGLALFLLLWGVLCNASEFAVTVMNAVDVRTLMQCWRSRDYKDVAATISKSLVFWEYFEPLTVHGHLVSQYVDLVKLTGSNLLAPFEDVLITVSPQDEVTEIHIDTVGFNSWAYYNNYVEEFNYDLPLYMLLVQYYVHIDNIQSTTDDVTSEQLFDFFDRMKLKLSKNFVKCSYEAAHKAAVCNMPNYSGSGEVLQFLQKFPNGEVVFIRAVKGGSVYVNVKNVTDTLNLIRNNLIVSWFDVYQAIKHKLPETVDHASAKDTLRILFENLDDINNFQKFVY